MYRQREKYRQRKVFLPTNLRVFKHLKLYVRCIIKEKLQVFLFIIRYTYMWYDRLFYDGYCQYTFTLIIFPYFLRRI